MPNPRDFLGAFKLFKGVTLPVANHEKEATIVQIKISHVVRELYREYEFPMQIYLVSPTVHATNITQAFQTYIQGQRIVSSRYNNPYNCYITIDKVVPQQVTLDGNTVWMIQCTGYATRILIGHSASQVVRSRKGN